jgi:hypothetical protein
MSLTRSEILTMAKVLIGRTGETLQEENNAFDWALRQITHLHNLLYMKKTGTTTANQNYVDIDALFTITIGSTTHKLFKEQRFLYDRYSKSQSAFKITDNDYWVPYEPREIFQDRDQTDTGGSPQAYTIENALVTISSNVASVAKKLIYYPYSTSDTYNYEIHAYIYHPPAHDQGSGVDSFEHLLGPNFDEAVIYFTAMKLAWVTGDLELAGVYHPYRLDACTGLAKEALNKLAVAVATQRKETKRRTAYYDV